MFTFAQLVVPSVTIFSANYRSISSKLPAVFYMQTTVILLAIEAIADSYSNSCMTVGLNLISADSYYNNRKNINSVAANAILRA